MAIRLACAMSLLDYFRSSTSQIEVNDESVDLALRFYIEEASSRSQGRLPVDKIMKNAGLS